MLAIVNSEAYCPPEILVRSLSGRKQRLLIRKREILTIQHRSSFLLNVLQHSNLPPAHFLTYLFQVQSNEIKPSWR